MDRGVINKVTTIEIMRVLPTMIDFTEKNSNELWTIGDSPDKTRLRPLKTIDEKKIIISDL